MSVDIDRTGRRLTIPGRAGTPLAVAPEVVDPTVIRLACDGAEATIFPAVGFNLLDWRVPVAGEHVQVMHAEPDALAGGSGTRSGHPILFPFPNRIAHAAYDWDGTAYHLAVSHPGDEHAIHGFVAKRAWATYEQTGDHAISGEFLLSRDAADVAASWPGDLRLTVTFELAATALTVTAQVDNVADRDVPFGLGYHPYFAPLDVAAVADLRVQVRASESWVLEDLIPTGELVPVAGDNDLLEPVVVGNRRLDDVLTGLDPFVADSGGLMERARLVGQRAQLSMHCDESFRDLVVFVPDNRESIAVEPYTCPTDAVHLEQAGLDVGWRTLAPGGSWRGIVEHRVSAS